MVTSRTDRELKSPTFPGLYAAQVEQVADLELGYIKVSIPSIFGEQKPECFLLARPCFPYGHFFVPEKEDKVWVAFENGDPTAPVWLGIWYPKDKVPEEAKVSPPVKRVIETKSGHQIVLNDEESKERIKIQTKSGSGHQIILNNEKEKESIKIHDAIHEHAITLDKNGVTLEVKGGITIQLTGSQVTGSQVIVDAGTEGTIQIKGKEIQLGLGPTLLAVVRQGDQGIGNLGAPVSITIPNPTVPPNQTAVSA